MEVFNDAIITFLVVMTLAACVIVRAAYKQRKR